MDRCWSAKSWDARAKVNFAVDLQKNVVPAANGASNGDFAGTLKMQYGLVMKGAEAGTLTAEGINADLVLDANSQALCPVCNKTVTWTAFSGNSTGSKGLETIEDGKHHHIYLSADVNAKNVSKMFLNLLKKSQMCLQLNGHDLTYGGYIYVNDSSVLNIMGQGNMTFTGKENSKDYENAGIYVNYGTVNLYGGTYRVAEAAEAEGKPMIYRNNAGSTVVKYASVYGQTYIKKGTITLENEANLENIQVETAGKLVVKSSWSGEANISFAAQLINDIVPAANGSAESGFTGVLTMPDGTELVADGNGKLAKKTNKS